MFILTQPQVAPQAAIPGIALSGTLTANTSGVLDTVSSTNKTLKWIVEVFDDNTQRLMSYEILASNFYGNELKFSRQYVQFNTVIDHVVDVVYNGNNDIELQITNNEANDINFNISRIQLIQ